MQIKDTDIYKLNYFTYNRAFTGSYGNMRYRLIRKKKTRKRKQFCQQQFIRSHTVGKKQRTKKKQILGNFHLRRREEPG